MLLEKLDLSGGYVIADIRVSTLHIISLDSCVMHQVSAILFGAWEYMSVDSQLWTALLSLHEHVQAVGRLSKGPVMMRLRQSGLK